MTDEIPPAPYACEGCNTPIIAPHIGRPPKFCADCRDPKNRARDQRTREAGGGAPTLTTDTAEALLAMGAALQEKDPLKPYAAQLIALGLADTDDPAEAARMAGLDLSEDELHQAANDADLKHRGLTEGDSNITTAMLQRLIAKTTLMLLAKASKIAPSQLANTTRNAANVLEFLSGGARPTYSSVVLVVRGPDGQEILMGKKA